MMARDDEPVPGGNGIDEEPERGNERALRVIVALVSAIVISALVIVPVLRYLTLSDEDRDPETAARQARRYVAEQFANAALGARSTRDAAHWALPGLEDTIDAEIVGYLQSRDPSLVDGARVTLASSGCQAGTPPRAECFQAWLQRPGDVELIRIAFAVAIASGRATVVRVSVVSQLQDA